MRDRRGDALRILAEYDERHRAQLLNTLEEFLKRRGNIAAAAQTLYVHPNTLRQRLRRIQDLTGLDVTEEDWLMIEIELKLLRLETALGRSLTITPVTPVVTPVSRPGYARSAGRPLATARFVGDSATSLPAQKETEVWLP